MVRIALYSLLFGLALGLLVYPDKIIQHSDAYSYTTITLPIRDYILQVIRFAIRIMFAALAVAVIWEWSRPGLRARLLLSAAIQKAFS